MPLPERESLYVAVSKSGGSHGNSHVNAIDGSRGLSLKTGRCQPHAGFAATSMLVLVPGQEK